MNAVLEVLRGLQTCQRRSVGFPIDSSPYLLGDSPSKWILLDTSANAVLSIKEMASNMFASLFSTCAPEVDSYFNTFTSNDRVFE